MAAYAAAGISGSKPMEIGVKAVKFGFPIFIVPFLMAYRHILFDAPVMESVIGIIMGLLGTFSSAVLVIGYLKTNLNKMERILCAVATVCFYLPWSLSDVVAIVSFVVFIIFNLRRAAEYQVQEKQLQKVS